MARAGMPRNISAKLGIRDHFEDIFDIADAGFTPKPEPLAYDIFLKRHGVNPRRPSCSRISPKTCWLPHALGMATVLVLPKAMDPYRESFEQSAEAGRISIS